MTDEERKQNRATLVRKANSELPRATPAERENVRSRARKALAAPVEIPILRKYQPLLMPR